MARGARVIGTASHANQDYLHSVGAEPVAYGKGFVERVHAFAPDGVDAALDVDGSGVPPKRIVLAGGVTIAGLGGVTFSSGYLAGRADYAFGEIGALIGTGRFSLPVAHTCLLAEIAEAHRGSEKGHVLGKLVLLLGRAQTPSSTWPAGQVKVVPSRPKAPRAQLHLQGLSNQGRILP